MSFEARKDSAKKIKKIKINNCHSVDGTQDNSRRPRLEHVALRIIHVVRSPCRETQCGLRCQKHTQKENQNNTPQQMCLRGFASRPPSFGDGRGRQVAHMCILAYVYIYIYIYILFFFVYRRINMEIHPRRSVSIWGITSARFLKRAGRGPVATRWCLAARHCCDVAWIQTACSLFIPRSIPSFIPPIHL